MRKNPSVILVAALALILALPLLGQGPPPSPPGSAATQVGKGYSKWITIDYSRPILRGRSGIFGEGAEYGKKVYAGAPVWRAGANVSTRIKTEVALKFGETAVPAGEYSLFIELKSPTEWTLLVSTQPAMSAFDRAKVGPETWGAYGYDASKVIAKTPMTIVPLEPTMDELTWVFTNVTEGGGTMTIVWDKTVANASFTVAE